MEQLAQLEAAGVSLGGGPVLRSVDMALSPGEVVGITGLNGSGKTTLIRVLATLTRLDSGSGRVLGADLATPAIFEVRPLIGMIGHTPALIPELTLSENLGHVCRLAGVDQGKVMPVLDVVGLAAAADRRAQASSFGMRRRVEVAQLLLTRPRLLLLDEAVAGLDDSARDLIAALVDRTVTAGGGAVVVSHDAAHLERICHRVMRLTVGRLEPAL